MMMTRRFSRTLWFCNYMFGLGVILSSLVMTSLGEEGLVAVLAICSCVHVLWFHVLLLLGAEEGCDAGTALR